MWAPATQPGSPMPARRANKSGEKACYLQLVHNECDAAAGSRTRIIHSSAGRMTWMTRRRGWQRPG